LITINHPLDVVEPLKIRDDGFHGRRCEVHIVNPWNFKSKGVKGKYIDAVSLYLTVMHYYIYPVGHPTKTVCVDNLREKKKQLSYTRH